MQELLRDLTDLTVMLIASAGVSAFQLDPIYAVPILFRDPSTLKYSNALSKNHAFILHANKNSMVFTKSCIVLA